MKAKFVNEAIKHLSPKDTADIDLTNINAKVALYTRIGMFVTEVSLVVRPNIKTIYPDDFMWLGIKITSLDQFIKEVTKFAKNKMKEHNCSIYVISIYNKNHFEFVLDNANEDGYADE